MERRWSVKPLVLVTAEVRFLSSAFEKERGVTGSIAVSKTAGFGSNPGAPAKFSEGSHNGIAAVPKTAGLRPMRVRFSHPPPELTRGDVA